MLQVPLITKLTGEVLLENFWSRPKFGHIASAAGDDIGAKNPTGIFSNLASELLGVWLITILAPEMRLNFIWSRPKLSSWCECR